MNRREGTPTWLPYRLLFFLSGLFDLHRRPFLAAVKLEDRYDFPRTQTLHRSRAAVGALLGIFLTDTASSQQQTQLCLRPLR